MGVSISVPPQKRKLITNPSENIDSILARQTSSILSTEKFYDPVSFNSDRMRVFLFLTTVIFGNEICKKEIIKGEHCEQDFRSIGKFTTAFPWSYQADISTR